MPQKMRGQKPRETAKIIVEYFPEKMETQGAAARATS